MAGHVLRPCPLPKTLDAFRKNMTFEHEHNFEFYRLLDAVLKDPEKVPDIVRDEPEILKQTNFSGETVLVWLALENHFSGVKLLRSLGAKIPHQALYEAVDMGHTDMVALLLELGADKHGWDYEKVLTNPHSNLSKEVRADIRTYLKSYK